MEEMDGSCPGGILTLYGLALLIIALLFFKVLKKSGRIDQRKEKLTLGLAAPPKERIPMELLDEAALVKRAVARIAGAAGKPVW